MKFRCETKEFGIAIGAAAHVARSRTNIPVLRTARISASHGEVDVCCNDMEMQVRARCTAVVDEPGEICLPAARLEAIMHAPAGDEMHVKTDDLAADIACGAARYRMYGMPPAEFPDLDTIAGGVSVTIDGAALCSGLRRVQRAATRDGAPVMRGVALQGDGSGCMVVGCDGRRLSRVRLPAGNMPATTPVVLPMGLVGELVRLWPAESVRICIAAGMVSLEWPGMRVVSRLIEGAYPDWQRVIPAEYAAELPAPVELETAVQRVATMTDKSQPAVTLQVTRGDGIGVLTLTAETAAIGTATESLPVEFEGEIAAVALDATYLTEALRAAWQDTAGVSMAFSSGTGPVKIESADYLGIIMPMRL